VTRRFLAIKGWQELWRWENIFGGTAFVNTMRAEEKGEAWEGACWASRLEKKTPQEVESSKGGGKKRGSLKRTLQPQKPRKQNRIN